MFSIPGTGDAYGSLQRGRLLRPGLGGVQWAPMAVEESGIGCGADENAVARSWTLHPQRRSA